MARLARLQRTVRDHGLDALVVTHLPNINYLIGYTGSNGILVVPAQGKPHFFTDFRYKAQVKIEVAGAKISIVDREKQLLDAFVEKQLFSDFDAVGFEEYKCPFHVYDFIRKKFRHLKLVPKREMVETMTMIKTDDEIEAITKAAAIGDQVFEKILDVIKPGVTELEVSAEISYLAKKLGGEGDAFEVIVASGERTALPHGIATDRKIKKNELVTIDFGCKYKGFNSDMTRTVSVGKVSTELQKIYDIVRVAQQRAIDKAKPGMNGRELDNVARDYITLHGYGSKFGHGTGHGIGIEVHEVPIIAQRGERFILEAGMVFTIEPGIYVEGIGGVRIEDDVVVTNDGVTVLNKTTKDLLVL
ncbi:MAG TPA: Xaa-Pro peptidase family protein [Candidatus Kapabacteria bacterium]